MFNKAIMETGDTDSLQNAEKDVHIHMKHAFDLVERSKQEIKLLDNCKKVILVLGVTGTGKSTFTQWIVGDNSMLIAKDMGSGEFLIYDVDERIGRSTINSKTIFPELVVDPITNNVFYDCPGFGDTRSTGYDLATTHFIKVAADHAECIKMIFTVSYSSVKEGENRKDFMSLMRNAFDFIKDIDQFRLSIALVVTKVDNIAVKEGGNYKPVSDESIIKYVADFLMHVKEDLKNRLKSETSTEKKYHEAAIKIIDIMLFKNGNQYTKIGLFRRPDEKGPLSKINTCQIAKNPIKKIIFEELDFTYKNKDSFGYGLSEKLKNDIYDSVEEMSTTLRMKFEEIADYVQKYFLSLEKDIHIKLDSFATAPENVETAIKETRTLLLRYRSSSFIIADIAERINNLNEVEEVIRTISKELSNLKIAISDEIKSQIINEGKYLAFLEILCEKNLNTKGWSDIFQVTLANFDIFKKDLQLFILTTNDKIGNRIRNSLYSLTEAMKVDYDKKTKSLDVISLIHKLQKDQATLYDKINKIKNTTAICELVGAFYACEKDLEICIPWKYLSILLNLGKSINFLENLNKKQINSGSSSSAWSDALQDVNKFLLDSEVFKTRLFKLYNELSEYKVQKHKNSFSIRNIKNCKQFSKDEGKVEEMSQVSKLAFENETKISFVGTAMVIKAQYISLKNIPEVTCDEAVTFSDKNENFFGLHKDMKTVCLIASSKIFIDQDVLLKGKGISVLFFAPTCEVIDARKIDLSNDGNKSGGFVFSACYRFLNYESLTILTHNNQEVIQRQSNLLVNIIPGLQSNDTMDKTFNQSGAFITDSNVGFIVGNVSVERLSTPFSRIVAKLFKPKETYTVEIFDHKAGDGDEINIARPVPICKDFVRFITLFRHFLLSNISDGFKKNSVFQCLKLLDNSEIITNAYNALEFHNEFLLLVKEHPKLHKEIDFNGFYQSLLYRIGHFNSELNHDNDPCDSKILLSAINSACSVNINSLHYRHDSYLTNDIYSHLKFMNDCIKIGKEPQTVDDVLLVLNKIADNNRKNIDEKIQINRAINTNFCIEINAIKGKHDNEINKLLDEILVLKEQSEMEKQNFLNMKEELQDFIQLRCVTITVEKFHHIIDVLEIIAVEILTIVQKHDSSVSGNETTKLPSSKSSALLKEEIKKIKIQNNARMIIELLEENPITYKAKMDIMANSFEQVTINMQMLKLLEDKICQSVIPILEKIEIDIDNSMHSKDGKTKISLDIGNWKVQGVLKDIQSHLIRLKQWFKISRDVAEYIEKLEESTITMIHIYNHLLSFKEIQLLNKSRASYYAAIAENVKFSNQELATAFQELRKVIDNSFLLKQYNVLMDVLKQWIFPFGYLYEEHYHLQLSSNGQWYKCVSEVRKKLKEIKDLIIDQKTNMKHDLVITDFLSGCVSTRPFFVWENEQYKKMISKLLSGEKVVVKADIAMSPSNKYAIKLIHVDLYFRARDNDTQSKLDEALKKYKVKATHLGNSYYRCGDRIYVIPTGCYTFEWSFEKSRNGESINNNSMCIMLQSGGIVLSPYAMWEIELLSDGNNSFQELDLYKNKVNLELIGKGSYIDEKMDFSELELGKYYNEFLFN
ncbi:uncharacterized protein [Parasteatoda tepidariorum]|uniref:uncharacterized protein n=1 Tax=Parasteatoda tepidariorum TaxID=114398 RepID=UPI001C729645|nr:uncharacterized protein LOC107442955 [Parasteatoda tepidariorum]XP_015912148.2 uncharacterized protein LOC107442955 [Parasteatoda tepidariorum]XP_015912149.2 uncharacterized protein LOC107442955 [Parasteatoda tepidariorum]XP_042906648.1 uncharacterized protein LOC107442955 [Parasteatoda tepidariorum]